MLEVAFPVRVVVAFAGQVGDLLIQRRLRLGDANECRRLLEVLGDAGLRAVALWKMEGYTNAEIADKLGCTRRTVERKLRVIRAIWAEEGGP